MTSSLGLPSLGILEIENMHKTRGKIFYQSLKFKKNLFQVPVLKLVISYAVFFFIEYLLLSLIMSHFSEYVS